MEKEKIAFVIHGLEVGGSEKFMLFIANEFCNRGYAPIIISLSDCNPLLSELNPAIRFLKITRTFRWDFSISRRIKRVIENEEITKVFCVGAYSFFLAKLGLFFNKRIKFFLSLHTTQPKSIKGYIRQILFLQAVSKRDVVIFISFNQREYYYKKYFLPKHHDIVIVNGINVESFSPHSVNCDAEVVKAQHHYTQDEKILLMVATIRPEKGHYYAIDALKILREEYNHKEARLVLVGGGEAEYINNLKEYACKKGVDKYVDFRGNFSDVRQFYLIADLFTLTSYSETFSLAALEAMAFGVPCSLTDIGGANEMVIEGKTGALSKSRMPASIAESWYKLLHQQFEKEKIRQFVLERYDAKRMFEDYYALVTKN